jgi:hypothetical protein
MFDLWQAHLSFTLVAFLLLPTTRLPRTMQCVGLLGLLLVSFIPFAGLPLAAYPRSVTDDLAISTLVVLLWAAGARLALVPSVPAMQRWQLILCVGALATFLYPATLGLTYIDPYRLGYSPRHLIIAIGLLALLMFYWRNALGVLMLGLATLAFSFDIKASDNYWDYLLDPFLAIYCWGAILIGAGKRGFSRYKKTLTEQSASSHSR